MTGIDVPRPHFTGFHHFSITVTDVEASVDWYQQVLGLQPLPMQFPTTARRDPATGSCCSNLAGPGA